MNPFRAGLLFLAGILPAAGWELEASRVLAEPSRGISVREAAVRQGDDIATITAIVFSEKTHRMRVIDSPAPGQTKLAAVLETEGIPAGVNGGFFHEDMRPVGLLVADGVEIHPFQKAKLLSGVLSVRSGRMEIVRSSAFRSGRDLQEAIQCGPMLVEAGSAVGGLSDSTRARRTVVLTDGRGRWGLVYATSLTLADTARILLVPGVFGDWTPRTALNLDGGGSSGLWAMASPTPVSRPEFSRVRNYIGVVPK